MTSIDNMQTNIENTTNITDTVNTGAVSNNDTADDTVDETVKLGVSKFKNMMGVTCYMNSILHILQQTPTFIEYISQAKFRDSIMKKINKKLLDDPELDEEQLLKEYVIFELFRLFKTSLENDDSSITPTSFKAVIGKKNDMWNEFNHQDSRIFKFFNFST